MAYLTTTQQIDFVFWKMRNGHERTLIYCNNELIAQTSGYSDDIERALRQINNGERYERQSSSVVLSPQQATLLPSKRNMSKQFHTLCNLLSIEVRR